MYAKAAKRENEILLRKGMEGKTKTQDLVTEDCSLKSYFREKSLTTTREMFRIRTNMNKLRGNFKHDKANMRTGVKCVACGLEEEVNSHVMVCLAYQDLKQGRDFMNNLDLVKYFRDVMARREEILKGN